MNEFLWTYSGFAIRKRPRDSVVKDQLGVGRIHKFTDRVFESERDAVAYVLAEKRSGLAAAETALKDARKSLAKWEARLAALESK